MAILNVDAFRGKLTGGGARANMFSVKVNFPGYSGGSTEDTDFMCRSAQLPASTVGLVEVPFRGRIVKLAGDRTFEPWTITVYNDTNFTVRNGFEAWMDGLNTHRGNEGTQSNDAGSTYAVPMTVSQLDQLGTEVKKYTLVNAFPTNVSAVDLDYAQVGEIETFTVTIEYDYWTNDNTN
jgi:hypothetical protein